MQEQQRTITTNKEEADALRTAFKGNEAALKIIRGLFLGFTLSEEEKGTLRELFGDNPTLVKAVRNKFYKDAEKDAPIGQNTDFWAGTERNIIGQNPDTIAQVVHSKLRAKDWIEKSLELLTDPSKPQISIDMGAHNIDTDSDPLAIQLVARNLYLQAVESGLNFIKLVAETDQEEKSEEDKKKDSTK